jgi:hypothetical protein
MHACDYCDRFVRIMVIRELSIEYILLLTFFFIIIYFTLITLKQKKTLPLYALGTPLDLYKKLQPFLTLKML